MQRQVPDHDAVAPRGNEGTFLWCDVCMSATVHHIGHLLMPLSGYPRCQVEGCGRWVGYACDVCGSTVVEKDAVSEARFDQMMTRIKEKVGSQLGSTVTRCPECSQTVAVVNGTIQSHNRAQAGKRVPCPGSGRSA